MVFLAQHALKAVWLITAAVISVLIVEGKTMFLNCTTDNNLFLNGFNLEVATERTSVSVDQTEKPLVLVLGT